MRFPPWIKLVLSVVLYTLLSHAPVEATHLRAGQITVQRVNCSGNVYRITITVFTNTGSSVLFGGENDDGDILDFGDGDSMLIPTQQNIPRPDLGDNIGMASFTVLHTYTGGQKYLISYREANRNEGVLNMDNSVQTKFYLETEINTDPFLGCDNSPVLSIPPIDQACVGVAFQHNPGAYDPDGDSLSYEFVVPKSDTRFTVINYRHPNGPEFYSSYSTGNETQDDFPTFEIDPITGTITWDAPGNLRLTNGKGEYNIAFIVRQWRKSANGLYWIPIGYVRRDMQIIVNECDNERPELIVPEDVCVEAGTLLEDYAVGTDPDNDQIKLEAFSEVFNLQVPLYGFRATLDPVTPLFEDSPDTLFFSWQTSCSNVKAQPYQVVFKITDNGEPRLTAFETWNITVVGPKPVFEAITTTGQSAMLDWEDYPCAAEAESIQIWRRVDSLMFTPDSCQLGMLPGLGYELVATVPANGPTTYTDSGLDPGAVYCYRLVATFPSPRGGESPMSEEVCTDKIISEAPIITHVSVEKTDEVDGEIVVRWAPPELGQAPFSYDVYRGTGFGSVPTEFVGTTTYDSIVDTGINTENLVYTYFIISTDDLGVEDTSAVASSVRLELVSLIGQIQLFWFADVPWSNSNQRYPTHDIYRGPEGSTDEELQLIASVNVLNSGFTYIDDGSWNSEPLQDGVIYCYKVVTRGGYGEDYGEPFLNNSQMICAPPGDSIPPCQVEGLAIVDAPDCNSDFLCSVTTFTNTITWDPPLDGLCQDDIAYYNVYISTSMGGAYFLPEQNSGIRLTTFVDDNLTSYARCYRVSAVDWSGNEGPLSDPVCVDNCPQYILPNMFTPESTTCNQLFSAYNNRPQPAGCSIAPEDRIKCARFVESVYLKVFNRWGKQVYEYRSGGERTIYIDWDGTGSNGEKLSSGIYYYVAEVEFDTIDPSKRNATIKSWVHIVR